MIVLRNGTSFSMINNIKRPLLDHDRKNSMPHSRSKSVYRKNKIIKPYNTYTGIAYNRENNVNIIKIVVLTRPQIIGKCFSSTYESRHW